YTRSDVAYYAINDRAAGRRVIELDLMTAAQRAELPENEEITAADRLIVASPTTTGLIMIRALAPEAGWIPAVRSALAAARCRPQGGRLANPLPHLRSVRTTTATATRSARFGLEVPARRLGVSFDSDDRKDDDGRRFGLARDRPWPLRATLRRLKMDHRTHIVAPVP